MTNRAMSAVSSIQINASQFPLPSHGFHMLVFLATGQRIFGLESVKI